MLFISQIIISIGLAANISEKYSLIKINTSINSTWLIGFYKMSSKLKCFAQCNYMTNCYSVAYSIGPGSTNNCACYSKEFAISESIVIQNTYLYSKQQNMQNLQQQQQQQQQCKINMLLSSFIY